MSTQNSPITQAFVGLLLSVLKCKVSQTPTEVIRLNLADSVPSSIEEGE